MAHEVVYCFVFRGDGEDAVELDFFDGFDDVFAEGFGGLVEVALWQGAEG